MQDNDYYKDMNSFIDLPDVEVEPNRRFVNFIRATPNRSYQNCVDAIDAMTLIRKQKDEEYLPRPGFVKFHSKTSISGRI